MSGRCAMQVTLGVRQWTNNQRVLKLWKWKLFFDCKYPVQMPMTAGKVSHQVVTKLKRSRVRCDGLQRDGRVPAWARRTLEEHMGHIRPISTLYTYITFLSI